MARVHDFQGGLSLLKDPILLSSNEATQFVNIDSTQNVLKSAKGYVDFTLNGEVVTSPNPNIIVVNSDNNTEYVLNYADTVNTIEYQGATYISYSQQGIRPRRIHPNRNVQGIQVYEDDDGTSPTLHFFSVPDNSLYAVAEADLDTPSNEVAETTRIGDVLPIYTDFWASYDNSVQLTRTHTTDRLYHLWHYDFVNGEVDNLYNRYGFLPVFRRGDSTPRLSSTDNVIFGPTFDGHFYLSPTTVHSRVTPGEGGFAFHFAGGYTDSANLNGVVQLPPEMKYVFAVAKIQGPIRRNDDISGTEFYALASDIDGAAPDGGSSLFRCVVESRNNPAYSASGWTEIPFRENPRFSFYWRLMRANIRQFYINSMAFRHIPGNDPDNPSPPHAGELYFKVSALATVYRTTISANNDVSGTTVQFRTNPAREPSFLGFLNPQTHTGIVQSDNIDVRSADPSLLSDAIPLGLRGPSADDALQRENISGNDIDLDAYTFPEPSELLVESKYTQVGERSTGYTSTTPDAPYPSFNLPITTPLRLRLDITRADGTISGMLYDVALTDDALYNITPPAQCIRKGSIFTRRTECRRSETRLARTGLRISLPGYEDHTIRVNIIDPSPTSGARADRLLGTIAAGEVLETDDFITIENPGTVLADYNDNTSHAQTIDYSSLPEARNASTPINSECTVQYAFTYYNSLRDIESIPSPLSEPLSFTGREAVTISGITPPTEIEADITRLYRICPQLGETRPTLIGEIVNVPNLNTGEVIEGSFEDELGPASLGGLHERESDGALIATEQLSGEDENENPLTREVVIVRPDGTRNPDIPENDGRYQRFLNATGTLLYSTQYREAPQTITFLAFARGALFGIDGNRLRWSITGQYDYWPAANFIDFDDRITGLLSIRDGLLVFTREQTHLLTGDLGTTNVALTLISTERGCIEPKSCKYLRGTPVWLSSEGVTTYLNGRANVISRAKLGDVRFENIINCVVHNEVYYILYNPTKRLDGTTNTAGNILLGFDVRYIQGGAFVEYEIENLAYINILNNYSSLLGSIRQTDGTYKLVRLFEGEDDLEFRYTSPILTGGDYSRLKTYERFYARYDASSNEPIRCEVSFEGANQSVRTDEEQTTNFTLESNTRRLDKGLPNARYYAAQVKLTGKGKVYEYQFVEKPSSSRRQS